LIIVLLPLLWVLITGTYYMQSVWYGAQDVLPPAVSRFLSEELKADVQIEQLQVGLTGLQATGVSLRHHGRQVLQIPGLTLDYPLSGNPIQANVRQPEIWLSRDRQGKWNFEDLLPKPTEEEPVRVKLDLTVQSAKLNFEDAYPRKGRPMVKETVYPLNGELRMRDNWIIARVKGHSNATGPIRIELVRNELQTSLDGQADRLQWAFLQHYFPEIPAEPINATGNIQFQLLLPKDQEILYAGEGTIRADAVHLIKENRTLPWRDLQGELSFSNESVQANLRTTGSRMPANIQLALQPLEEDWAFQMKAEASGQDAAGLWSSFEKSKSPVRGAYRLQAEGWGTFQNPNFNGQLQVAQAQAQEYTFQKIRTRFLFAQGDLFMPDIQAEYEGTSIEGRAKIEITKKQPRFQLYASSHDLDLAKLPQTRSQNLRGKLFAQLIAQGTPDKPVVWANISGDQVQYRKVKLGGVRARIEYRDKEWFARNASISGEQGYIQVSGKYLNNQLNLKVEANEIDLNRLSAASRRILDEPSLQETKDVEIDGIAYLQGQVVGTLKKPRFEGEVKIFDARIGRVGIEAARLDLKATSEQINLVDLELYRRSAKVSGRGSIALAEAGKPKHSPELNLQLTAQDISLEDIVAWSNTSLIARGLVQGEMHVQGTLESPILAGELRTEQALFDQVPIESARATLSYRQRRGLTVENAIIQVAEGNLNLQGTLSPDQNLHFTVQGDSLALRTFAAYLPPDYALDGTARIEGEFSGTLTKLDGSVSLTATQLTLNRIELGPLQAVLRAENGVWEVQNGVLQTQGGSLIARSLRYDPETENLTGEGQIQNLSIDRANDIARKSLKEIDPTLQARLDVLDGTINASWLISGQARQPAISIEGTFADLSLRDQTLGTMSLQAQWAEETLTLTRLVWRAGETQLIAGGHVQPEGDIDLDAELSNFPIQWARLWDPSLPQVGGNLDLTLLASGQTKSPDLRMSATLTNLTYREDAPADTEPAESDAQGESTTEAPAPSTPLIERILFSEIRVQEGSIETEDALISRHGYNARLSGKIPFHWSPLSVPRDEPLNVALSVREQSLDALSLLAPVDVERTEGLLDANLQIAGTLDALEPTGYLEIKQGELAWKDLRTYLKDVNFAVRFKEGIATLEQTTLSSSEGGTLRIDSAQIDLSNGLKGEVQAQVIAEGFRVDENKPFGVEALTKGSLYGRLQMRGAIENLLVEGNLSVRNGALRLPGEWESRAEQKTYVVNPRFNIEVIIDKGFDLSNSSLQARMEGALSITGSLQQPAMTGVFNIARGSLNLPTARLRISPESTILLSYPVENREGEITARLDLNLQTTTHVVATDFTGDPQRYLVTLTIRGPLDDPENFTMTASSDPPGLSERRILALLGRGSALEALATGRSPSEVFREQLSDVVTGQLLPTLLDPLEIGIATTFGLEQFVLDYNPLSPLSIYLVKNLWDGVGVSYRRTFSSAASQYELRLFYRLPFRNRLLQHLKVGWGINERQLHFIFIEGSILFR
jgi:autotransporter translocation and assembly factor TamB